MYVGIDIGGTKTLIAVLSNAGQIVETTKFPTPSIYAEFMEQLEIALALLKHHNFLAGAVAAPGLIDHDRGVVKTLGNLPWHNEPIQADCEKVLHCPILLENDAKLAALSEAMLHKDYANVLYITVSTGIGGGFVSHQRLAENLLHSELGHMLLPYKGKLTKWEHFASGKALYERYNRRAADIPASDEAIWQEVARNLALGFFEVMAVTQPDLIIIGGSIGTYFDRYSHWLHENLKEYEIPLVPVPKIVQAGRPEEAVVYGCYDLAKQHYDHADAAD